MATEDLVYINGPVSLRRLEADKFVLGLYQDHGNDGAAALLTGAEVGAMALAAYQMAQDETENELPALGETIEPFHLALQHRVEQQSGLEYDPHSHSGAIRWLAKTMMCADMTAGRYLAGASIPREKTAQQMSDRLEWPYAELVASIWVTKTERERQKMKNEYRI